MNVFLSWSGDRSKALATVLSSWLAKVLQDVKPWMSEKSIDPGERWSVELEKALETCQYAIICVTPENSNAPWLMFEAGALSRAYNKSKTVPLCCGLGVRDLVGPLAQFQCLAADEAGLRRLVVGLNDVLDTPLPVDALRETFDVWWPRLNAQLVQIEAQPTASGAGAVRVRRVLLAVSEDFVAPDMLAHIDKEILEQAFPGQLTVQSPTSVPELAKLLTTSRFDIVHLLAMVEPSSGKILLGAGESLKPEGLRKLLVAAQAKLAFLATCDSLLLGSEVARSLSVVAAFGSVEAASITAWERSFYGLLANGRPLSESYEIARESSDQPIVLIMRNDTRFIVEAAQVPK
jgi:hypothetical protein